MTTTLSTLIRNWTGPLPPPVIQRPPSARWGAARASAVGPSVRVAEVVEETPTVRTFVLEPVDGTLAYEAGQHLTVIVTVGDETLRRCYSFSTSPLAGGRPAITVRRVADGRVSSHLHANVRAGAVLRAAPPSGAFTLPAVGRGERRFALVAGGVGITPLIALAETALRRDPAAEVDLLCGHRSEEEIVFRARLEALQRAFGPRLRVRIALDEAGPGWTGLRGGLDGARVLEAVGASADAYYVCGPEPMMDGITAALAGAGVEPARIRLERFAYAAPAAATAPTTARAMVFAKSGRRVVAEPGQTILEAATRAGVALPSSCTMGGCGACKVKKAAGTVVSAEPNCLSERERAEGYVLTCCSYADDGLVVADY
ncbi:MAG: ferredoxin--NADP reductase [Candidatus Binatia bacterium]